MPFRYRRTVRLGPGHVNLSKSGASYSTGGNLGPIRNTTNFGRRGITTTASLPGTGLSWSSRMPWKSKRPTRGGPGVTLARLILLAVIGWVCYAVIYTPAHVSPLH